MFQKFPTQVQEYDLDDGKALFPILINDHIYYITEHENNIYKIDVTTGNKSIAFATEYRHFYRALFKTLNNSIVYIEVPYWSSVKAKMYIFIERNGQLIRDTEIDGFNVPIRTTYDSTSDRLNFKITPYLVGNTVGLCCTTKNSKSLYTIYNNYTINGYKTDPEYSKFEPQNATNFALFEYTVNDFTNGDNYYAGLYDIDSDNYINKMYRVSLANNEFIFTQLDANISPTIQLTSTSCFKLNDDIYFNSRYNNYIYKYNTISNEITETDDTTSEPNLNFCYNKVFCYTLSASELIRYKIFGVVFLSIFNYKNEKVLTVPSQYPIKGLIFTKNADNITVTITTNYSRDEYLYVVVEPLYKEIVGYGYNQDEAISFYFDTTYNVDIKTNTELYEEYQLIDGTPTKFAINLYKNSAESIRVDKSNYLTSVGTLSGVLREETSLTDMSLTIQYNGVPNFNYVYIPTFKRYYFVTDVTSVRKDLWEIGLKCDVLMSYQGGIKQLHAFVDRNEFITNPEIIDKKRVIQQGVDVRSVTLENSLFTNDFLSATDECYILTGYKIGIGGTSNG